YRAERDDELVSAEAALRRVGCTGRRVDRGDVRLDERDAVPLEQAARAAPLGNRRDADELPELAQPHRELGLAVDEDDLVIVAEQAAQLDRGGDAPEAAAEDQRPPAHLFGGRTTTSSSVGENLSMYCCTWPIRSLNSGCDFQALIASTLSQSMKLVKSP